ncbi:acyl--CoA ligase [Alicyclobacillus sp. TC]|uniref:Fatty-acyl-CoA synthase n=1 Tax=Alicyclobacillus tolerans TaxID=90970 RepID=A0A1M6SPY1_9BACL|nr:MULTISPECIES: class I adenylate-forming enzyme family protein [Alicyclobacillus]QRF22920.1 acyl--CoA ligase [Alicyclobacillus sp. TC]SHK46801.1 fatty-acyl-CoA synthase [Alicyclobacillus montanus]
MVMTAEERRQYLQDLFPVWPRYTLSQHFEHLLTLYAHRPLLIVEDNVFTYEEAWEKGKAFAKSLLKLGVKRRQHVALLMANEADNFFAMLGVWMIGAVCVPINTMLRSDEIHYLLRQSDSRWLIMHQTASGVAHDVEIEKIYDELTNRDRSIHLEQVVCIQNSERPLDGRFISWETFQHLADDVSDEIWRRELEKNRYPDEVADIIYTSGSTGLPKGVMITHDMFLRCGFSTALSRAFEDGRRIYTALPLYHVFALVEGILAASFVGGTLITSPRFTATTTLQMMEKYKATDFLCVPSMLVAVVNHPEVSRYDVSVLNALMCAAAPAPIAIWERAVDVLGVQEICAGYGGTEATAATVHTEVGAPIEIVVNKVGRIKPGGSSGLPEFGGANCQYKTIDPFTGEDLPPGEVGELTVRGNLVTRGYYNKPEETAAVIDKDGWFRTGDLGRIDEEGYLELLGRSKELYKISGENVAPKEVEDVICKHPAVAQAYVVGVKDAMTHETGAAFIELKPGVECSRRDIIEFCQERLAKFKIPRHVWFVSVEEWPMTGTGKIQKFKLQEMAEARLNRDESDMRFMES